MPWRVKGKRGQNPGLILLGHVQEGLEPVGVGWAVEVRRFPQTLRPGPLEGPQHYRCDIIWVFRLGCQDIARQTNDVQVGGAG